MSRRAKIIIAAFIALTILAIIVLLLLMRRSSAPQVVVNEPAATPTRNDRLTTTPGTAVEVTPPSSAEEPVSPADGRGNVERLAAAFVERYGSFSTQGDFENILDLAPLMTAEFAASSERLAAAQRVSRQEGGPFIGVTVRALSSRASTFDDTAGRAVVAVKIQKNRIDGSELDGTVSYGESTVFFLKLDGQWKVDGVESKDGS